jgi:hypothetical protein
LYQRCFVACRDLAAASRGASQAGRTPPKIAVSSSLLLAVSCGCVFVLRDGAVVVRHLVRRKDTCFCENVWVRLLVHTTFCSPRKESLRTTHTLYDPLALATTDSHMHRGFPCQLRFRDKTEESPIYIVQIEPAGDVCSQVARRHARPPFRLDWR